ncbi:hypothetical protein CEXT_693511 [Caerostris extrusa]|uniref:Secreted protein n=1 Tax=Caerostris extrusa TaxID=172846 RepID=A0AAV4N2D9_CAEEX|nr:hypothetical protein CEXT_693511 [Caerostris extrusa]
MFYHLLVVCRLQIEVLKVHSCAMTLRLCHHTFPSSKPAEQRLLPVVDCRWSHVSAVRSSFNYKPILPNRTVNLTANVEHHITRRIIGGPKNRPRCIRRLRRAFNVDARGLISACSHPFLNK